MWYITVYPKKYAHGFCFAVLCCGYTLTDFPISIRLTSLALWQSNDCPSASKATLMNMDKYFMWIHYERLHNHNKAKHNKTVCIFLGMYCTWRENIVWSLSQIKLLSEYPSNTVMLNDSNWSKHACWCTKHKQPSGSSLRWALIELRAWQGQEDDPSNSYPGMLAGSRALYMPARWYRDECGMLKLQNIGEPQDERW